jgi:oxygen-dependent protoporphyrinogen oxidase
MKAIVVGAGLAGLTAGYKLKQAGWDVTVLEAGSYAGGRSATVRDGGYSIDTAATQLSSGYKEYLALVDEVGLSSELMECSQIVGIARDGRVVEIDGNNVLSGPLSPIVSLGSKFTVLKTLIDKLCLKPRLNYLDISDNHANDDESFRDYGLRRLSREAYDFLAAPLLRGNFLRNPDRATKLEWFAITDNFAGQKMLTMRGGITRLPTLLASMFDTRLNAPATRVEQQGDKVAVSWTEQGQDRSETVDACVIATRLPEAMAISPAYAQLAAPLGAKLRYSRGLLVHLGFRKTTHSKTIGVFLPQQENKEIALIWVEHNKTPECAPPGHSLITCYFDDACTDDCYNMADEKVIDIARRYLEKLFPELEGQCDLSRVSRWPLAISYPEPGVYREIHKLKTQIAPTDRIQYAADYFTCTGQNSAIHYGKRAAENLVKHCRQK